MTVLNYRGNAGIEDMDAFNARLHFTWKGDHLFRVYPLDGQLYFIRVGGSKTQNAAVGAQFGLLGALFIYFANKREKKKTQSKLNEIAGANPAELLARPVFAQLLSEWAREYGKSQELIRDRINRGWTEEMAVTKPARRYQTTGGSTDGMVGGRGQRAAGDDAEGETE